jgi:prepilin signal peptidase PulO-like enzyme (type II secretory pathway)
MTVLIFVLGLIFGSFGNVIILNLNTGESLIFRGSRCFVCGRKLGWFDMVPVASFLFLKGRCRLCLSRISLQYPLFELASAALFLLVYYRLGFRNPVLTIIAILFFWLMLMISAYDIRHKIIPDSLVYIAISVALIFSLFSVYDSSFIIHLLAGIGLFVFFAGLSLASRGRWMGFGDAKLALAIGLALGWPEAAIALLFSFWIGALFGLALAFVKKLKNLKIQIPFAPFLFLGSLTAFLWGNKIIAWYFSLL